MSAEELADAWRIVEVWRIRYESQSDRLDAALARSARAETDLAETLRILDNSRAIASDRTALAAEMRDRAAAAEAERDAHLAAWRTANNERNHAQFMASGWRRLARSRVAGPRFLDMRDRAEAAEAALAEERRKVGALVEASERQSLYGDHGKACAVERARVWGRTAVCSCGRDEMTKALSAMRGGDGRE